MGSPSTRLQRRHALPGGRQSAPVQLWPCSKSFGHDAEDVRDIGLGASADAEIARRAQASSSVLITRDLDFANIRVYPPGDYCGLVVMRLPDDAVAAQILNILQRFLKTDLIR